jgi:hypothetical protein
MSENAAPISAPTQTSTPSAPPSGGAPNSPTPNTSQAAPNTAPETFDVKVNGKVVKMTRDEVINHASMSSAAQARFEEAAKMRKTAEQILETQKKNPIQALKDAGLSNEQIRAAIEKYYYGEFVEPETLTAEQKKLKEYEEKLKNYEQAELEKKQREEKEQEEQLTTRQREYLQSQIIEALDKSGLPKTKFFASRMAFYMRQNFTNGWEAPIEMIVQQVKKERQGLLSDMSSNSSAEQLIEMLGDETVNKIRKYDLERLRARRQTPSPSGMMSTSSPKSDERISSYEVNRRLNLIKQGKL